MLYTLVRLIHPERIACWRRAWNEIRTMLHLSLSAPTKRMTKKWREKEKRFRGFFTFVFGKWASSQRPALSSNSFVKEFLKREINIFSPPEEMCGVAALTACVYLICGFLPVISRSASPSIHLLFRPINQPCVCLCESRRKKENHIQSWSLSRKYLC